MTTRLRTMRSRVTRIISTRRSASGHQFDLIEFLRRRGNGGGDAHVARQFHQDVAGPFHARPTVSQAAEFGAQAVRFGRADACRRPAS